MSIMGDKIHRIRDFRGMTQKQLGMADLMRNPPMSASHSTNQALVHQNKHLWNGLPRCLI